MVVRERLTLSIAILSTPGGRLSTEPCSVWQAIPPSRHQLRRRQEAVWGESKPCSTIAVPTLPGVGATLLRTWPAEPHLKGLSTLTLSLARPPPRREGDVPPCPPPALPHRNTSAWSRPPSGRCPLGSLQVSGLIRGVLTAEACALSQVIRSPASYKRMAGS